MGCGMALYYCNIGWLFFGARMWVFSIYTCCVCRELLGLTGKSSEEQKQSAPKGNARIQTGWHKAVRQSAAKLSAQAVYLYPSPSPAW
jgi:hypothetical protein